ncbi:MAG: ROK family protein [Oscillospiraceae bacterium]|jgi:glucokinase|nr:ROK family protein [Oscillospiraceae bacterium]
MKHYVGIDLGATSIKVGVVTEDGKIIARAENPTLADRPWQPVVEDIAKTAFQAVANAELSVSDIEAFGMGVPGICVDGVIPFCTNLHWHNVPINEAWSKYTDKPLFVDNDANCAALAEAIAGVSAGVPDSVFLTLGTGLGSGIIIEGKLRSGGHGVGGELGHIIVQIDGIPCTCGKRGCLERYTSATALIRLGVEAMADGTDTALHTATEGDPSRMTAKIIVDAAKAGDRVAVQVFEKYTEYLAIGINNIISFIDPDMIVLGGGVSRAGQFLLDKVNEKLPKYIFFKGLPHAKVMLARLGNEAGIIGAALLGEH